MTLQYATIDRNNQLDALESGAIQGLPTATVAWAATTAYTIKTSWCINDTGKIYLCTGSGTSAGSGGPTGTGSSITDGSVTWTYIGQAGVGGAPTLSLYSGTEPANCGTALSGNTLLATGTLPADWLANASSASKAKAGTWTLNGQSGAGAGTAATFFRILDASGACRIQGTVTASGSGGDMTLDNNSIANLQVLTEVTFAIARANG